MVEKKTRRQVIKAAAYVAPVVLTLSAKPATARGGSGQPSGSQSGGSGRPGSGT
ncbi:MAG: hypothetical protein P8Y44_05045 [Acidobacteriota bacterium]